MPVSERSGQARFGRTEDRDDRHAEQRGQVHRAGVVSQEQRHSRNSAISLRLTFGRCG